MTSQQQADLDQALTFISESCPPLWRRLFENLVKEGFSESQALDLLKTYISATYRP